MFFVLYIYFLLRLDMNFLKHLISKYTEKNDWRTMQVKWSNFADFLLLGILDTFFGDVLHHCEVITYERYNII